MGKRVGRKPTSLKRVLSLMVLNGYLNTDLVLGIRDWNEGLKEGRFGAEAKNQEEQVARTEALMRGMGNPRRLAVGWVERDGSVSPESEAGLRAWLSDEMAYCLRKGGVLLPGDELRKDVASVTEQVVYQLKPELQAEVQKELGRETEGQRSSDIEGTSAGIA